MTIASIRAANDHGPELVRARWRVALSAPWMAPLWVASLVALPLSGAVAQDSVAPPACQAPAIPVQFESDAQQNQFTISARDYETCINAYVKARQDAAVQNRSAGNAAAAAFNEFAGAAAAVKPPPVR
ncbi:MAG: hypothetical protein ACI8PT_001927 [Gammaproteobacteria bacterium]|jgi:hypothetical protein